MEIEWVVREIATILQKMKGIEVPRSNLADCDDPQPSKSLKKNCIATRKSKTRLTRDGMAEGDRMLGVEILRSAPWNGLTSKTKKYKHRRRKFKSPWLGMLMGRVLILTVAGAYLNCHRCLNLLSLLLILAIAYACTLWTLAIISKKTWGWLTLKGRMWGWMGLEDAGCWPLKRGASLIFRLIFWPCKIYSRQSDGTIYTSACSRSPLAVCEHLFLPPPR